MLTMNPEARRKVVRLLGELDAVDAESLESGSGTVAFVGLIHTLSLRIGDALDA
jgi:hypothetical protein